MGRKKKTEGKESEDKNQFYWDIYDLGKEDLPQEDRPYPFHKKSTKSKDD